MAPQHGDALIARDAEGVYTISIVPGEPQVRYSTYEEALAVVTTWALRQPLVAWFTEDGKTFTAVRLAGQRTPASDTPRTPKDQK